MYKPETRKKGMLVHSFIPMEILRLIDRSAEYEGMTRSAFIRHAALIHARKIDVENNPGNADKLNPGSVTSQNEELKPHDRTE